MPLNTHHTYLSCALNVVKRVSNPLQSSSPLGSHPSSFILSLFSLKWKILIVSTWCTQTRGQTRIKPCLLHFPEARIQVWVQHGDSVLFSVKGKHSEVLEHWYRSKGRSHSIQYCLAFAHTTHATPSQDVRLQPF